MNTVTVLPSKFVGDRIYLCPTTVRGVQLTFWTDTGGPTFIKREKASQLGLTPVQQMFPEGELDVVPYPEFKEGLSIPHGSRVKSLFVRDDSRPEIDGMLGMPYFADRVWIFDYLNHQVMHVQDQGDYIPCDGHVCDLGFATDANGVRQISFPRIQATIDGETFDFLFDTGATVHLTDEAVNSHFSDELPRARGTSFITASAFETWKERHPEWVVIEHGDMLGNEAMIQVPVVELAGYEVGPVWFTRRADPNFHEWFSQWMDKRIDGALGGSVFRYFSIVVDYPRAFAHFSINGHG